MAPIEVTEQETAVHVFAHADGPHADVAWRQIRDLWSRCHAAGLTEPVVATELPATLPSRPPRDTAAAVALCQSPDAHRQALLRVEHDVLVLSLLDARPSVTWQPAEAAITDLVGAVTTPGMFGSAWLRLGKADRPDAVTTEAGWDVGTDLGSEVVVREVGERANDRVVRRLVVLAPPDRDLELGGWTWSDRTPRMPGLVRYLMHLAKVRYQLRVHTELPGAARLYREVESALADPATLPGLTVEVVRVVTALRAMLRTVEIARYNAALALDTAVGTPEESTAFADDETLVQHLLFRLDDDRAYLETALDAARTIIALPGRAERRPAVRDRSPTFGVVTAMPEEFTAIWAILDDVEVHHAADDPANYVIGTVPSAIDGEPHVVALTMLGETANNAAAAGTAKLNSEFVTLNCVLMVGVAAGVPRPAMPRRHVRLGDIVVATWGVVDFDHVVDRPEGRTLRQGHPRPSPLLCHAAKLLVAAELMNRRPWEDVLDGALERLPSTFARPDPDSDVLYGADDVAVPIPHPHPDLSGHRPGRPKVHHGRIGSADRSLRNLAERDALAAEHDLLAIEMEATGVGKAGFADGREWFIVRGVSDYGDRRTDTAWRHCAALVAAAYTRSLLAVVPTLELRAGRFRLPEK